MAKAQDLRRLALALEGVTEAPHFDRAAFRTPKRIFVTLAADGLTANVKLEPVQQDLLVGADPAFAPVKGAWGAQGWTTVTLADVSTKRLGEALAEAHALANVKPARRR